ncbi:cytochrome P450 sterol C22-desaturase [Auriculariales sp. MPI-PUGE-AT-0066]|nr:cytochrome P450 sterol C22-desaturase [Auriculariales sp. MPI-PUGE-AT-0066]
MAANVTTTSILQSWTLPADLSGVSLWYSGLAIVGSLLVFEQIVYRQKKQHLPGPAWKIPVIGKFMDSRFPTMEKYKLGWKQGDLSAVSVFNIFIVMATTNDYTRRIFNSPAYAEPCLVASAKQVLEPDNWVFLNGKEHVDYRRILNTLFTRKALSLYLPMQDTLTRRHIARWLVEADLKKKPQEIMTRLRDVNMEISLKVFCGSHIPDSAIAVIVDRYWTISIALQLVNFPFAIPGTATYRAIQARKEAMKFLTAAAASSKAAMAAGREPECMIDEWVVEIRKAQAAGKLNRDFSDREMALVVLSFLFASQDAMSSGLVYMFQHFADHPDILARTRKEQEEVRGGNYDAPLTLDMIDEMHYMKACIKESMRVQPPVTMVPYLTTKPFPISPDYTVPKGTMVIPSVWPSCYDEEVFPDPAKFIPERWLDEKSIANMNPNKYLVFGSGPHRCIGMEYAKIVMSVILGNSAVLMNWEHHRTGDSETPILLPTLFPKDGCIVTIEPRKQ